MTPRITTESLKPFTPTENVYFVHISDSHIGPSADYARHGHRALPCLEKVIDIIQSLPQKPDFVVHTGDVVTDPHPASYELAAETMARLDVPVYYVTGNHDRARDLHHYFPMGPKRDAYDDPDLLAYTFDVKGHRFMVVDARAEDEIDPHGWLTQKQLDFVRREVRQPGPPLTIFMHYPIVPINSTWIDAYMMVINGAALHQILAPARARIRGVFYGHIHQNVQIFRDGIMYTGVASLFSQFSGWPNADVIGFDPEHPPGYNFVHLLPEQTIVHQHTFSRP